MQNEDGLRRTDIAPPTKFSQTFYKILFANKKFSPNFKSSFCDIQVELLQFHIRKYELLYENLQKKNPRELITESKNQVPFTPYKKTIKFAPKTIKVDEVRISE
jgi:hypothetical protein